MWCNGCGVVRCTCQVSHDARLIASTECEIWVVGDAASGLRVERQVGLTAVMGYSPSISMQCSPTHIIYNYPIT